MTVIMSAMSAIMKTGLDLIYLNFDILDEGSSIKIIFYFLFLYSSVDRYKSKYN